MQVNKINNDVKYQNFRRGFPPRSKDLIAEMITKLKVAGKLQEARDCISLTKAVEQKAQNHTILDVYDYFCVVPDNANTGSWLRHLKKSSTTLKKTLSKISDFLDNDNKKIEEVKKVADKILPELKDTEDDIFAPGWHGVQSFVRKEDGASIIDHGTGKTIAEQLAKLAVDKNEPAIISEGLKLYKYVGEHPANCSIRVDEAGVFNITNENEGINKRIRTVNLFADVNILDRLRNLKTTLIKIEKTIEKKREKENAKLKKLVAEAEKTNKDTSEKSIFQRVCIIISNKIKQYFVKNSQDVREKQKKFDRILKETKKELE